MLRPRRGDPLSLVHQAAYGFVRASEGLAAVLPLPLVLCFGRALGAAGWLLLRGQRRRVLDHLALALPGLSPSERERIAREAFRWLGRTSMEFLVLPSLFTQGRWRRTVVFEDPDAVERVRAAGRGAIFVTGHMGNWEVFFGAIARMGIPLLTTARRMDNPYLHARFQTWRRSMGHEVSTKDEALREVSSSLEGGVAVGFLVDQNVRRGRLFTEFFGRPAATLSGPAVLAVRAHRPIIAGWAYRDPCARFRYRVGFARPILPPEEGSRAGAVRWMAQEFTRRIEEAVRRRPEEWLWMHRRWKRAGEAGRS